MTRRSLLLGLFAVPALTETITINAPENVWKAYQEFAAANNEWLMMRHDTPPGAYSFTAKKQWDHKVKPAFHTLDLVLKNE